jgi:hypothetical protein
MLGRYAGVKLPKTPYRNSSRFRLDRISRQDRENLEHLRTEFREAYNHYLRVIRETGTLSKKTLEKKTTTTSKRKNVSFLLERDILANTRQCARDKAVECVRLYHSLRQQRIKTEFPEFMYETVNPRLNWRDGYMINPDKTVRISVKKGVMVRARLEGSDEDSELIERVFTGGHKFNSAEIVKEGEDYFIDVSIVQ